MSSWPYYSAPNWNKYTIDEKHPSTSGGVCVEIIKATPQLIERDYMAIECAKLVETDGPQGQTVRITACPQQYLGDATATTSKDYPMKITIHQVMARFAPLPNSPTA